MERAHESGRAQRALVTETSTGRQMIPAMSPSGVLPPFTGASPELAGSMSPYHATMGEVADQLCATPDRAKLLRGLLALRAELHALGIVDGYQWLDGSFCEDVEKNRGRPPGDIDVVTLLLRPAPVIADPDWQQFCAANQRILDSNSTKALFSCDAFYIDAGYAALLVADQVTYWFGLFTHQRVSYQWKGILQIPLMSDDTVAMNLLDQKFPLTP